MTRPYLELTRLIERMHRRFLDVLRAELAREGIKNITSVQALLLANINDEDIVIRDLIDRGYYQGSNVSYNLKKLSELGYIEQERSDHDRRSVRIRLTPLAQSVVAKIRELEARHAAAMTEQGVNDADLDQACQTLRNVEHVWTDDIRFGRR